MINRCVSLVAIIASGLLLAGCYTDYGPVVAAPPPIPIATVTTHFQVGDRVTVTIYDEPNLSGVYDVNPSGVMVLPLVGAVRAVGLTRAELEREITERYSRGKFLEDPQVTLDVVQFRPIYIFGEVEKPGAYPYAAGLNVLTAVTTAGGLTYRGDRSTILVQRAGQQVWTEYPLISSVAILPGDLIQVPERYF
jgi:protein involved in polysaccharide export with SLBB domain